MKLRDVMGSTLLGLGLLLVGVAGAIAAPAPPDPNQPMQITVSCSAGQTIQAALAKVPKWTPARISVKGTCTESVVIEGYSSIVGSGGATVIGTATGLDTAALKVVGSQSVSIDRLKVEAPVSSEFAILMKRCLNCSVTRTEVQRDAEATEHEWGIGVRDSGYASIAQVTLKRAGLLVQRSRAEVRGSLLEGPAQTWAGVMAVEGDVSMDSTTIRSYGAGVAAFLGSTVSLGSLWPPSAGDRTIRLVDDGVGVFAAESSHVNVGGEWTDFGPSPVRISSTEGGTWAGVWASSGAFVNLISNVSITGTGWFAAGADGNATVALGSTTIDKSDGNSFAIEASRRGLIDFGPVTVMSGSGYMFLNCDGSSAMTGTGNVPPGAIVDCPNVY